MSACRQYVTGMISLRIFRGLVRSEHQKNGWPENRRAKQPNIKNPPEEASGGYLLQSADPAYAFDIAAFTASAVMGSERTRAPDALKMALASAGAITVTAGSPTPVAFSPLAITLMATSGS